MNDRIYEKLNEIKDLNDRVLLKNIMVGVFETLEEYSEDRLQKIERRVFNEVPYIKEKYNIYSTIVRKEKFDVTDEFLFPILSEDLEEKTYDTKEILKAIEGKEQIKLFKIFMKCDYVKFKEFINENSKIIGIIKTDKQVHKAEFKVTENNEYKNKIKELYESFINSNIAWTTINNPYIYKFANVILTKCEGEIKEDETITEMEVDFGEYKNYVEYNMVPLWNIKELYLKCNGFPIPCIDKVELEHSISIEQYGKNNGYLVCKLNPNISNVMFTEDAVIIHAAEGQPVIWNLLTIINSSKIPKKQYEYELMTNKVNVNFSNKLAFSRGYTIKTKTELTRLINSFKASKYLNFIKLQISELVNNDSETYEVNDFIIDEIREENIRKALILYFKPLNKENYLNKDILSFLVSEVQFIYPEYKCEGRLI